VDRRARRPPLRDWQARMRESDANMPRALGDLYGTPPEQQPAVAEPRASGCHKEDDWSAAYSGLENLTIDFGIA
jgi:hypothetical protein